MIQQPDTTRHLALMAPEVAAAALAAVFADFDTPASEIKPIRMHPASLGAMMGHDMIVWETIDNLEVPTALGAAVIQDEAEPVLYGEDELAKRVLQLRGFIPLDAAPAELIKVGTDGTIEVHPDTLNTMFRSDMVDVLTTDGVSRAYYVGREVLRNDALAPVTDVEELAGLLIDTVLVANTPKAPCNCPPGTCMDDAAEPEMIEGEAFEPYEVPVVDAGWTPVPAKREILADIATCLTEVAAATSALLAQLDRLQDDE